MRPFKKLELSDREWVNALLRASGWRGCEYSFSCAYMWQEVYRLQAAELEGCLVIRSMQDEAPAYLFPAGNGDLGAVVQRLGAESAGYGAPLRFYSLTAENRDALERLFPGEFAFEENPDAREYLYEAESLRTLSGSKLHAKRNHIRRFTDAHPDWSYEPVNPQNLPECEAMCESWYAGYREAAGKGLDKEMRAVRTALRDFFALGLRGGLIRTGGRVVAFAAGERLGGDTFDVRIEKAYHELQGAYALINREFARSLEADIRYINREDDAGDEGLRRAKLSYRPALFLDKWTAQRRP